MDRPVTDSPHPPIPYDRLTRLETCTAVFLIAASLCVLLDKITQFHTFTLLALGLAFLSIATSWPRVQRTARLMAGMTCIASVVFFTTGGTLQIFLLAASRALFLPALLTVMTVLQVSAQNSQPVGLVARFVVDQPPSRRFAALTLTGHIFGILLNIAGYRFLLTIALDQCRKMTQDLRIRAIQERRVINAVLCGFGATILWSPVGIALNLLLPLMEGFDWIDYAPYGFAAMLVFVALRYLFDATGPRPARAFQPGSRAGVVGGIVRLMALLCGVTGTAALAEKVFGIPMQGALLIVIPLSAVVWRLLDGVDTPRGKLADLTRRSFAAMPRPMNEITLLLATGFLGLLLVELIPSELVLYAVTTFDLSPAALCAVIVITIAGFSIVGINPMISGTVCVGAVLSAQIAVPYPMLLMATLTGWSVGMLVSPVTATVIVTAAISGLPVSRVGLRWNGPFILTYACLMMVIFAIWGQFL